MPERPRTFKASQLRQNRRAERRASAARRGYDRKEQRCASIYLRLHPVCEIPGCDRPSTDADHIVRISDGGARLGWENLQALCHECHARKTQREGARGDLRCDLTRRRRG